MTLTGPWSIFCFFVSGKHSLRTYRPKFFIHFALQAKFQIIVLSDHKAILTGSKSKVSYCLGVNVFGLWKHNFWWNTLHTESDYGGRVPEFSAESLCAFVRGWQLVTVSVTWPFWIMRHQLEDDSWDMSRPVSLFPWPAWKRPRYWTRKTMCPGGESRRPSVSTKGGQDWTGTPVWTSQLSPSN